jgi:RND family efflux transporter MFP subunit
MQIKKKYIIWAVIALLAGFGIYYFFIREKAVSANKIEAKTLTVEKSVSVNGEVSSNNHAELSFGTTGRVRQIYVEKDQTVKSGDLLAQIDASSAYNSLESLDDVVDIAKRQKDEFIIEYSNHANREEYGNRKYEETVRKLDEQIHKAQNDYKAQLNSLKDTSIKAPFNGTIVEITKEENESAALGEKIITLVDTKSIYFEADLEQEDFGFTQKEQSVEIILDSYEEQNKVFTGKVYEIPQFINPDNDSITVKISIDPSDVNYLYGMTGEARIIIEKKEDVKALTFDQVFTEDDGKNYVWIVEKTNGANRLKKLPIEIGLEGDVYTEIKTDLNEYTLVVPPTEDVVFEEGLKVNIADAK